MPRLHFAPFAVAVCALLAALGPAGAAPAEAQRAAPTVHEVQLRTVRVADAYAFVPAVVTVRPGDRVRFRLVSGGPHSVSIAGDTLAPEVRAAWARAMPRTVGALTGPLLVVPGTVYEFTVPAVPPGRYDIYCLPKLAFGMEGAIVVRER